MIIRRAAPMDARNMADLLNQIIRIGGTTALTHEVSTQDMRDKMSFNFDKSAWHLAETDQGEVLGFQWIAPHADLPPEACDIATFVKVGQTGLGIGSGLFEATRKAAKRLGYSWINASIRSDNSGGLIYYQSRSFEDWKHLNNVKLADGTITRKILKRYDL